MLKGSKAVPSCWALEAETSGVLVIVDKSLYHSEPRFTHLYKGCENEPLAEAG